MKQITLIIIIIVAIVIILFEYKKEPISKVIELEEVIYIDYISIQGMSPLQYKTDSILITYEKYK